MLPRDTRAAIFELHAKGHGIRPIARALRISRNSVRRVLASGVVDVPVPERPEKLIDKLDEVRTLYAQCKGNRVRVHEELSLSGSEVKYTTLTAFCRRHDIGTPHKLPAGRYHFEPGEEGQHDTSPHNAKIGGKVRRVHTASLVLCYSRMIHARAFPRFNRFWAKVFLAEALVKFGGSPSRIMVDNTSVLIAHGTGENAVAAAEIASLGMHFGFVVEAHAVGDANRSARVERPFSYIENNFYAGRDFRDLDHLNEELAAWCDRVNDKPRRWLGARPVELHAAELPALNALPIHIPEITEIEHRIVDLEAYVTFRTNRYSAPAALLHRSVQVLASSRQVRIFDGHRLVAEHPRMEDGSRMRSTLPGHEHQHRLRREHRTRPIPEAAALRAAAPELSEFVTVLERRHGGRAVRPVRALHQLYLDYPTEVLIVATRRALLHGVTDPDRLERIVLGLLGGDIFRLPTATDPHKTDDDEQDPATRPSSG